VSLVSWRAWPHACVLAWVVVTSLPLLLTTRVDAHRMALLVIPACIWAGLGIGRARRVLACVGVSRTLQHLAACALLATVVWTDLNLLYFSPARVRSHRPYSLHFDRYPVPHEPVAGEALAAEIKTIPGPVAVGMVLDGRDRGWVDLALLERARIDPRRWGTVLPEGLLNDLRNDVTRLEAVAQLVRMARDATILLAPATAFADVPAALEPRGLRVAAQSRAGLALLQIETTAGAPGAVSAPVPRPTPRPRASAPHAPTPGGRRVWLSDLPSVDVSHGFLPPHMNRAWDGGAIEMDGVRYAHGLGVHAWTRMTFAVPAAATAFEAVIGLADDTRECEPAAVTFEVLDGAGRVLFDSGLVVRGDPPQTVRLPLDAVSALTLVVTEGGNGRDCDHANWADAAFVLSPVREGR